MDAQKLAQTIEGLLFWKGEALSITELSKILAVSKEEVLAGIQTLETSLAGRGIQIIQTGDTVELRTAPSLSSLIETLTKEELDRDLGKAGLETLTIILYEGPITRREIDYIRGVNSQFIVRSLLVRGLVERVDAADKRAFAYRPTGELLAHMGITKREELPEYESHRSKIASFTEPHS